MQTLAVIKQFLGSYQGGLAIVTDRQMAVLALNDYALNILGRKEINSSPGDLPMVLGFSRTSQLKPLPKDFLTFFEEHLKDGVSSISNTLLAWTCSELMTEQNQTYYLLLGNPLPSNFSGDKEQKLFRNIINNIPQYIFWKDKHSVFLGCNENFSRLLGLPCPENIIGKTDYDFSWSQDQTEQYRKDDYEIINTKVPKLYYEEKQTDAQGVEHDVLVSKIPLYSDDNKDEVIGIACIYQDITEKKQLERVLLQAKIRAESANRAKSEFIANMSHDIRTPITGMLGLAQFLKDSAKTPEVEEYSQLLIESTGELLKLLNEVIEIVNLESATQAPKLELFNLNEVLSHNMILLAPAAKHKGITLEHKIFPKTPIMLFGSRTYLDRILLNVMSNAVKFTNKGGVYVTVAADAVKENTLELVITIRDTGIGIPDHRLSDIFDRYSRVTPSHDGIYKGSGIGLYVVKKYLDEIRGNVQVHSELNKGSTFTLRIPYEFGKESPLIEKETIQLPVETSSDTKGRVLIVEDNLLAARMAMRVMEKEFCYCDIASSAESAFQQLKSHSYDLILMDIGLPDKNGLELARKIRSMPHLNRVPIIALTGHISSDHRQSCLQAGMQDVVIKPINRQIAAKLIAHWMIDQNPTTELPAEKNPKMFLSIDLQEGTELSGGCEASALELVDLLISSLPKTIEFLQNLLAKHEWSELSNEAHKLYGGLCYVGVPRLRHIVKMLNATLEDKALRGQSTMLIKEFEEEATYLMEVWR